MVTSPFVATLRTPSRECQSSIRISSAGAATAFRAWVQPFSALGEMNSRKGASIAVSPAFGSRGLVPRNTNPGGSFEGTNPMLRPSAFTVWPVPARASTIDAWLARARRSCMACAAAISEAVETACFRADPAPDLARVLAADLVDAICCRNS